MCARLRTSGAVVAPDEAETLARALVALVYGGAAAPTMLYCLYTNASLSHLPSGDVGAMEHLLRTVVSEPLTFGLFLGKLAPAHSLVTLFADRSAANPGLFVAIGDVAVPTLSRAALNAVAALCATGGGYLVTNDALPTPTPLQALQHTTGGRTGMSVAAFGRGVSAAPALDALIAEMVDRAALAATLLTFMAHIPAPLRGACEDESITLHGLESLTRLLPALRAVAPPDERTAAVFAGAQRIIGALVVRSGNDPLAGAELAHAAAADLASLRDGTLGERAP